MADFKVYNPLHNILHRITEIEKDRDGNQDNIRPPRPPRNEFLPLLGGEMSGAILQPLTPHNLFDLTNKHYVDSELSNLYNKIDSKFENIKVNDATDLEKGIIKLSGDLSGTADNPVISSHSVTNEKLSPCFQPKCLKGSTETSSLVEDLVIGKGFKVNGNVINVDGTIFVDRLPLASQIKKGILQLSGDLSGTSDNPLISSNAVTNSKLAHLSEPSMLKGSGSNSVDPIDIQLGSGLVMVDDKLNIDLKQIVTLPIPVSQGGTGHISFPVKGYLKGDGDNITLIDSIPVTDMTGVVTSVNGVLPNKEGNVNVVLGNVTTGTLSELPSQPQSNGSMFVVSGDVEPLNNGRTYVSDGDSWNEITFNLDTTDARYLLKGGDTLEGNLNVPSGMSINISDIPKQDNDASNKKYVDSQIKTININDATLSVKGILKLTGDLAGTADSPLIKNAAISNTKLANMTDFSQLKGSLTNSKAVVDIGLGIGLKIDNSQVLIDSVVLSTMFLPITGGSLTGSVTQPFPPTNPDDLSNKTYVDTQVNLIATPDASSTMKGKLQLTGDLSGSASSPRISNLAVTNAKMANMSNINQLKGSNSINSTVVDINVGHGLTIENNSLYGSVSFFTGNNPNLSAPEERPNKPNVAYVGSDGSLWIWSGSLPGSSIPAAPGSQYSRGPGALNVLKSNTLYTIPSTSLLSSPITLGDFNIQVPSGSKIKVNYILNFQNSGNVSPNFGWTGVHQTLDFFQASIIGFFGTSLTPASFSTIYQTNTTLSPLQTGGADLYALATINSSNSVISSTLNLGGVGGQSVPIHIMAYYENNSGSLTTLGLLFNRDLKTSTGQTIQIAGGVADYTFY